MARYNANRVPYTKQEQLLSDFCSMLLKLKSERSIKNFLKDLLNRQERVMLIRRLLIAELLVKGYTYRDIQKELHAGPATIARIDRWLNFGRGGYQVALNVLRKK